MANRIAWGVVLWVLLLGPPHGPALGAGPPVVGEDEAAFSSLRLPESARLGVGGSQLLDAIERVAPVEPWRPRTNPERWRGPAGRLYPRAAPATVVVRSAHGHGSGFFIAPDGWILTNHHVVEGAAVDETTGALVVSVHWGRMEGEAMRVAEEALPALVHKTSKDRDLALLKVRSLPRGVAAFPAIALADRVPPPGGDCVAIGHPAYGTLWTVRSGEIAGVGTWPREMIDDIGRVLSVPVDQRGELDRPLRKAPARKVVLSTCGLNPGDSGGPLLDDEGRLIAVSFAIPRSPDRQDPGTSVDKFSYHVHLDEVRAFLADRPRQPALFVPDPWPPADSGALLDLDEDGTDETLAFGDRRDRKLTGLLIDLDQDSRRKNPSAKPEDFVEGRTWDFEFALHLRPPARAFYDTDGDGTIDLILNGSGADGDAGGALERKGDAWSRGKRGAGGIVDPSRFSDPDARERLVRILKSLK